LAGQPDAFPSQESELRLGALGQALCETLLCKALANFISPITLWLDNRMLSPPKSQSCDWGAWGEFLVKSSRCASQLYFTDYTLTGQPILPLPNGTMVGLVASKSRS
jgi:hypothetical protein